MARPDSLIVEGKCFWQIDWSNENYNQVRNTIIEFLRTEAYMPKDIRGTVWNRFMSISFIYEGQPEYGVPMSLKIKRALGLMSNENYLTNKYLTSLKYIRDDLPYEVSILITFGRIKEYEGFIIDIRSEPVVLFKMRQLGYRGYLDEFDYNNIITTNKHFIKKCMTVMGAHILEEPKALSERISTTINKKLESIRFNDISLILKNGKNKINEVRTEDGLTDLREALTQFIAKLVEMNEKKPTRSIKKDLETLKELGHIDNWIYELMEKILCDWIYRYLSAKPVHRRERINYDDAIFIFSISENIISHLIDKVVLGR